MGALRSIPVTEFPLGEETFCTFFCTGFNFFLVIMNLSEIENEGFMNLKVVLYVHFPLIPIYT